ncbi:MAG: flagellar protein [Lachnospiraceae bacterium]
MNVKNCKRCKRLFNYVTGPMLCAACREEEEAKFQEVKKYVSENINTDIQTVSEVCDVSVKQIQQWVREERLVFSDDSPMGIGCERCGAMIKSGKYCAKCKADLTNVLNNAIGKKGSFTPPPQPQREGARMRYLDKQ